MDLGSLFVIIAMLILVGLFVSRPFFSKTQPDVDVENSADHELSELLAERDQILNALQELDFDAGLGKIPSEDYPSQRAQLLQQGAEILRRLDAIQENGTHETDSKPEDRIEAAVAARRADAALVEGSAGTTKPVANGSDETADDGLCRVFQPEA